MNRGVVVGLRSSHMVVLSDGNFVRIPLRPGVAAGDEITFSMEEMGNKKKRRRLMPHVCLVGLAAAAVILFGTFLPSAQMAEPGYAVAVVDINPSIELVLNQEGEVIEFTALNDDGLELGDLKLIGLAIGEAIESIISGAEAQGFVDYLDETNVLVTMVPMAGNDDADEKMKENILADLTESQVLRSVNLALLDLSEEEYRDARYNNKPVGLVALPDNHELQYETVREYFSDASNVSIFEKEGAFIRSENQALWHIVDCLEQFAEEEGLDLDLSEIRACLRSGKTELPAVADKAQKLLTKTKEAVKERKEKEAKANGVKSQETELKPENSKAKADSANDITGLEKAGESKAVAEENKS